MQRVMQQFLFDHQDVLYKTFNEKLIPNETNIVGVRVPLLREYAKGIVKSGKARQFLIDITPYYHEEHLIYSFVLGMAKLSIEEKLLFAKRFIPHLSNWASCDSFCSALKDTKKHLETVWSFLMPYVESEKVYDRRFAVVMLLNYYVTDAYLPNVLAILNTIKNDDYYIMMAIAWAISICYIKMPKETETFLIHNDLDDETHNKAIQKIIESTRIDPATKQYVKTLKRKKARKP